MQGEKNSNFLGEVILNLAKLIPYDKQYIEQIFDIKQGKTIPAKDPSSKVFLFTAGGAGFERFQR